MPAMLEWTTYLYTQKLRWVWTILAPVKRCLARSHPAPVFLIIKDQAQMQSYYTMRTGYAIQK